MIFEPKQAVIFKTHNPDKFTSVFPKVKVQQLDDGALVAVPHRPDETLVLRNMGYDIPAPMNKYYAYKGRFQPFDVQKTTAEFASMNRRCFILNSMGLGKTITTLWAYDYLRSIKAVHRALVICPVSVMERTWADEVFKSFPHLTVNVLYGTKAKREKLLEAEADIYVLNTDAVNIKTIKAQLAMREDIDLVIIDEVALFRNHGTQRWKAANEICNLQCGGNRRVWGLTGSPLPNAPSDAFGQIKLVTPSNPDCPKYFGRFRDLVMVRKNPFAPFPTYEAKKDAIETVHRIMQPSIRFSLDDAIDLPPQIITQRKVELTAEQKKAYKEMMAKLMTEFADGKQVLAVNEAVKASKLLQICCGVAYGSNGDDGEKTAVEFDCKDRMEAVDQVICESEGKTIVFCPFTGALESLRKFLTETCGHTVEVVDGSTSKDKRDEIFMSFQESPDPKVILANPTAMAHGVTLTAATTICWYGPIYSNEYYQQACARVRRPGQKRSTVIVQIVSTKLEEAIYERIEGKQSLQGALLDLIRDNTSI
jgi:SNF2 family DNA or RNA helicase